MSVTIKTNNVPRDIIYGYELTKEEAAEFDYIPGWNFQDVLLYDDESRDNANEFASHDFFRYKGRVYDLLEFMRVPDGMLPGHWDGYLSDSFFSGIVVRYVNDGEQVVCGTYIG